MRDNQNEFTAVAARLFRIEQWSKNLFLLLPAFFAGVFFQVEVLQGLISGFILFSLLASAVYIFNDLSDVKIDRLHPRKRFRPIAAGRVGERQAMLISLGLFGTAITASIFWVPEITPYLLVYAGINVLYSRWLKKVALFDIIIVSSGFLIRVLIGGIIAGVPLSKWLILMTLLLSLLLAFAKRKDDLSAYADGIDKPKNMEGYSADFIKMSIQLLSAVLIVCYILYTVSPETIVRIESDDIALTSFPVILGVLRYFQQTYVFNNSGSPTHIFLKDRALQAIILLWFVSFGYFIYLSPDHPIFALWEQ